MRVKSRKPPAENVMTSDLRSSLEIGRGADDRIGDQMRQMRGHRQHPVVMLGGHRHDLHAAPASHSAVDLVDRRRRRCRAAGSGCTSGPRTARQSPLRGRNARCRRPDGRGRNARPAAMRGARSRIAASLTEPTSVTIAPGFSAGAICAADLGIGRERRRDHHQIGARRPPRPGRRWPRRRARGARPRPGSRRAGRRRRSSSPGCRGACTRAKRRADQPDPDQRHPVEQRLAHRRRPP